MTKWKIYNEDAVEWAKSYQKGKFHALLCDAPYHLTSIVKRFGKAKESDNTFTSEKVRNRSDGYSRLVGTGFMGNTWDGGDLAFRPETWEAFGQVLHPGAFGMAFSASRNWHRMAIAIEDAGFVLHPTIFLWAYGQGFPKATNISKQIDKDKNNSRSEDKRIVLAKHIKQVRTQRGISKKTLASWFSYSSVTENWERLDSGGRWPSSNDYKTLVNRMGCNESLLEDVVENERLVLEHSNNGIGFSSLGNAGYKDEFDVTKSKSELGIMWDGHRYGLQALKPAVEPIIVFQKPYEGKPLDNIVSSGAGALNIDGGRIPLADGDEYTINEFEDGMKPFGNGAGHSYKSKKVFKEDKRLGGNGTWKTDKAAKNVYEGGYEGIDVASSPLGRWPSNLLLTENSAENLDQQTGILTSGKMLHTSKRSTDGSPNGIYGKFDINHPLQETIGDSGGASRFFFIVENRLNECDPVYYSAKVSQKERNAGLDNFPDVFSGMSNGAQIHGEGYDKGQEIGLNRVIARKNTHPTLKPIELCKYLATLLLPPDKYAPRRIFVPFSGSGSEMIGAGLAGWEQICGVEFDKENGYVDIAKKRLEYWLK